VSVRASNNSMRMPEESNDLSAMTESGPLDTDYFSVADESDNAREGQVGPRDRRCWCRSFSRHEWSSVLRRPV
jgi:hypothetical protein